MNILKSEEIKTSVVEKPDVEKKSKFLFQIINIVTDFVLATHVVMSPTLTKPGDHLLTLSSDETKGEDEDKTEPDNIDQN